MILGHIIKVLSILSFVVVVHLRDQFRNDHDCRNCQVA